MPHIDIRVSKPVDSHARDMLQKAIAGSMEIIPGKTAASTVISISDKGGIDFAPPRTHHLR